MKVLLIADASSIWTAKYLEMVLLPLGYRITVLTPVPVDPRFSDVYAHGAVDVQKQVGPHPLLAHIPLLRGRSARRRTTALIRQHGPFDVVHVQMALLHRVRLAMLVGAGRVFVSFWGSDLLRQSPRRLRAMRGPLGVADIVTVNSDRMQQEFRARYPDFQPLPVVIPFGVNGLEAIDDLMRTETRADACLRFGFPEDRIVISAGYNARPEQQHVLMLRAIAGLPQELKQELHIVLPMTYGGDLLTLQAVREELIRTGCTGSVLTEFLGEKDQARLAIASDVFINAQTTDALSASLQEFLYAGATVLNAAWLDYPELRNAGVFMHEFNDEGSLTALLEELVRSFTRDDRPFNVNARAMRSRSWEAVSKRWGALYDSRP